MAASIPNWSGSTVIRVLLTLLLCAFSCQVYAEAAGHPVTLWRAEGRSNVVYLLGSIHLLRPEDLPLPTIIDAAYDEAEVLIMELDMDDMDPAAAQRVFSEHGVLRDGTTLRDLMGEEMYASAETAAEAIDIPIEMLSQSEPWLAAITVEMMALYRIGFSPMLGIEMQMTSKAVSDGKPIEGLEDVHEQMQFLDGLSLEAQRDMLLSTLEEGASIGETIDEMIRAWRYGDIDTLESGLLETFAEHEELKDSLVTQRNRRWVGQIDALLVDDDDYLVIVGAMHLVGADGVPNLLAEQGVDIRQLSEPPALQ